MTKFERALVKAFNRYFEENGINAIAYRRKQHKFSDQFCDILVDSHNPEFYLGIENKSIKLKSRKKLYFSQHFSHSNGTHQIDKITDFLEKSGRKGFLAIELKRGRGRPKKAFLVPWKFIKDKYESEDVGLDLKSCDRFEEMGRKSKKYEIDKIFGQ